jgi:ferritin-like metal-binding protein YciE
MIEKVRAIDYKILLRITQKANIIEAIPILKQSFEEEESMSDRIADKTPAINQLTQQESKQK